ncbi:alpha/beta hydrolase-fold protein [Dyadobacter chenwenxiniae]|uniref:Esterase n=1 Tax=Dyadobacter chenwenxiniae TaxID=2906456 RepID=A0A9X1PMR0_9BACT|nr:alpha/beta fold hydrolase [Dyadobacter chenwenxiniae]MCF0063290.1 esterase [Dyadobacter chenwenxiniae]UON85330.1 alpha/beta hydrolase-fold protein [Dyadobacter chenwenxiniae]
MMSQSPPVAIERAYQKWFSPALNRDMEMLVFGSGGVPVLFFPTRAARFYDLENWKIIEAMRERINDREIQVFCVDSVDQESFYSARSPDQRILRHLQYEQYILTEVIPFIRKRNKSKQLTVTGCSLGGYHAVNIGLKHPTLFTKIVGMSARYDLTKPLPFFADLFDGYFDENIYYNMPNHFVPGICDERLLQQIRKIDITLVIGREDSFLADNERLSYALSNIGVPHKLYIWDEEAHRPRYWREMVKLYL